MHILKAGLAVCVYVVIFSSCYSFRFKSLLNARDFFGLNNEPHIIRSQPRQPIKNSYVRTDMQYAVCDGGGELMCKEPASTTLKDLMCVCGSTITH